MAIRIYIIPMELVARPIGTVRQPKYIPLLNYTFGAIDYGSEDVAICGVVDISTADHNALALNPDVMALPANLDNTMGAGAVTAAKSFLEGLNIPANWINTTRTFRDAIRVIAGLFQFNQRWRGLTQTSPFKSGLNLTTQYNQLSDENKTTLKAVFDEFGIDRTSLTATSTLREGLYLFGSQHINKPLILAGVSI